MDYPEADRGKCITCGFAAKRTVQSTGLTPNPEYYDIPSEERASQIVLTMVLRPAGRYPAGMTIPTEIACYIGAYDLAATVRQQFEKIQNGKLEDWNRISHQELHCDRKCADWYAYVPGRTPQEHRADYMAAELEQKRQDFELKLFAMSQKVQEDSRAIAKDSKTIAKWLGVIVILLTIIQITLALVSYWSSKKPIVVVQPSEQRQEQPKQDDNASPR